MAFQPGLVGGDAAAVEEEDRRASNRVKSGTLPAGTKHIAEVMC